MNEEHDSDQPEQPPHHAGGNTYHQEVQHSPATARVPDQVGRGVFSTGAIVMHGAHDFVIDFVQSLAPPRRVVARIALPPSVLPLFVAALQENLRKYNASFGPVPRMPAPPPGAQQGNPPPPISDVYEQLKLPDEMLSGVYANTVVISHSPAEFCFDFVTSFYPRSAVSGRVYLSTPHVPELLDSLTRAWQQFQQKQQQLPRPPFPQPGE
ncbi:MAG: DUF3467 domain-containing protein [Planctomycetales bacterium]